MPVLRFRGNPYQVLDVRSTASNAAIKGRWRQLAREHHPDRAAGDTEEAARLTARMARINAAYDLLRDPVRRAQFDSSAEGRRARTTGMGDGANADMDDQFQGGQPFGPPPPPRTPPVTARFDTTASFRVRNATLDSARPRMRGHRPLSRRAFARENDLRASTPTGPVHTERGARPEPLPTLREARETTLEFGRYHGYTLGEVEILEPTYLDWVARTITRDRDLVTKARVIQEDLDRRGVARRNRPAASDFDDRAAAG
ncbi:MAG: J domain-containing protein [Chloroflexota bacterium]